MPTPLGSVGTGGFVVYAGALAPGRQDMQEDGDVVPRLLDGQHCWLVCILLVHLYLYHVVRLELDIRGRGERGCVNAPLARRSDGVLMSLFTLYAWTGSYTTPTLLKNRGLLPHLPRSGGRGQDGAGDQAPGSMDVQLW